VATEQADPFRRGGGHSVLQSYRSDAMAPRTHAWGQVAAATNVLFDYGKPIPRPDRFLSRDNVEEHVPDRIFAQTADNGQRHFKQNFNVGATVRQFCARKHKVAVGPRI
jgi:hypothetical protein